MILNFSDVERFIPKYITEEVFNEFVDINKQNGYDTEIENEEKCRIPLGEGAKLLIKWEELPEIVKILKNPVNEQVQ